MTTTAILAVTIPTRENREREKGRPKPPKTKAPGSMEGLTGAKSRVDVPIGGTDIQAECLAGVNRAQSVRRKVTGPPQ